MKTPNLLHFLLIFFFVLSTNLIGQSSNTGEEQLYVSMTLSSVIEVNQLSQNHLKIANTETVIVNYCDKYIRVPPGIHLLIVDINQYCHLAVTVEDQSISLESEAEESEVINSGLKTIDYFSNQVIRTEDYILYTICDTPIDRY